MIWSIGRLTSSAACGLALWACANSCAAHFLWIKTITHEGQPHAFLFFGENALDEAYKLPETLAGAKLWRRAADGKRTNLRTQLFESDDRIGLMSPLAEKAPCVLEASEQYGIYGTALLVYSAKHVHANSVDKFNAAGTSKALALEIVPRVEDRKLELTVLWEGKPLPEVEVSVEVGDAEAVKKITDKNGRAAFEPDGDGPISVLVSRTDENIKGNLNGKEYDHRLHFASLTLEWPVPAEPQASQTSAVVRVSPAPAIVRGSSDALVRGSPDPAHKETSGHRSGAVGKPATTVAPPPLPEPLSSFGAVVSDGWLYVYGGHTGTEHEHSAANLSNHFRRLNLSGGAQHWEKLPMQTPLQGLALVSYDGKVYRVGGMNARNATPDEEEQLHSTAEFAEFDPSTGKWTALAPLPAPRSSHNAVVIGDRLCVVGGWALSGASPGEWQDGALVFDFGDPQAGWQVLPEPPFKRRALAASHWKDFVVVIGGIDEEGEVTQRVDLCDPNTGEWSDGPELPDNGGHSGFGASAWNLNGELYVSGLRGIVYRLDEAGSAWDEVARLARGRFFHQLVPAVGGGLLAVGGASRDGHLADIEWIDVSK